MLVYLHMRGWLHLNHWKWMFPSDWVKKKTCDSHHRIYINDSSYACICHVIDLPILCYSFSFFHVHSLSGCTIRDALSFHNPTCNREPVRFSLRIHDFVSCNILVSTSVYCICASTCVHGEIAISPLTIFSCLFSQIQVDLSRHTYILLLIR
jgi:hypothetical protein